VSAQFRAQLEVLLHTLQGTQPHYVMCYKPNTTGAPNALDRVLLLEQLRYSGALEVVRIRQKGYDTSLFWLWQNLVYLLSLRLLERTGGANWYESSCVSGGQDASKL
jgi:hypothetical protein